MAKIRVIVADDLEIVRNGYEILFSKSSSIELCGTASNGDDAIALYLDVQPDVMLMDIMMPPKDGIKTCKELVFRNENAKVLLNTAFIKEDVLTRVLSSGASGLLLKDADYPEVEKAITLVKNGGEYYNKMVLDIMVRRLLRTNTDSFKEYWGKHYSDREISIIHLTSQGFTSVEIGAQLNLNKRTIEVSRSMIMKKMNVNNIIEMIIHSFKIGLLDMNEKKEELAE
jgi:DNA-binding NarL/FixJ family response regulator